MYRLSVSDEFDAAHFLRDYKGKCEALHGHTFKVVVTIAAVQLNSIGLAYDFVDLKRHLGEILSRFDHHCINDLPPFDTINASSENIALTVYNELKARLAGEPVTLTEIEVWESPRSRAVYTPD